MQWGGGHMMPRYPNYPPGMMAPRMRGMYGQARPMDPRQIEMERQHRQRMQMMHGGGLRPGMHSMQRPYPEVLVYVYIRTCMCISVLFATFVCWVVNKFVPFIHRTLINNNNFFDDFLCVSKKDLLCLVFFSTSRRVIRSCNLSVFCATVLSLSHYGVSSQVILSYC